MTKNIVDKKNKVDIIFAGSLLLSGIALYTANNAYNKAKTAESEANSAQSNLNLKLVEENIVPDNSSNSFTVFPSTLESGQINFKLNAGTDDKILLENLQGDKNDSINIRCNNGGITLNSGSAMITLSNLPTSSEDLTSGQLWNNNNTLNIIP